MFWVPPPRPRSHSSSSPCWTSPRERIVGDEMAKNFQDSSSRAFNRAWTREPALPRGAQSAHPPVCTRTHRTAFSCQNPRGPAQACLGPNSRPVKATVPSMVSLVHWPKLQLPEPVCYPLHPNLLPPRNQKPASPPLLLTICATLSGCLPSLRLGRCHGSPTCSVSSSSARHGSRCPLSPTSLLYLGTL